MCVSLSTYVENKDRGEQSRVRSHMAMHAWAGLCVHEKCCVIIGGLSLNFTRVYLIATYTYFTRVWFVIIYSGQLGLDHEIIGSRPENCAQGVTSVYHVRMRSHHTT